MLRRSAPEPAFESLDVSVVCELAGPGKVNLHPVQVRPLVQHAARKLEAVVHLQCLRSSPLARQPVEFRKHVKGTETGSR